MQSIIKKTVIVFMVLLMVFSSVPLTQGGLGSLLGSITVSAEEIGGGSGGEDGVDASFKMDLAFVVDTTGSMSDEIETAKRNMRSYISQLEAIGVDYRVAIVDYRDFPDRTEDDEDYPYSIISDFSSDETELLNNVNNLGLGYGGDTEETLYSALIDGLASLNWRSNAARVSIVIGDAVALDPEPYTGYTFDDAIKCLLGGNASYVEEEKESEFKPTRNHIYVFTICTATDSYTIDFFDRLSKATLGRAYLSYSSEELNNIIIDIISRVSELSFGIFQSHLNEVDEDAYSIFVIDSYGNAISGATVTWNDKSATTSGDGFVTFNRFTVGEPTITVSKPGYTTYTTEGTNYAKNEKGYDIITLYSKDESNLKLKTAYYHNAMGIMDDILTKTKKVSASNRNSFDLDDGKFDIYCAAIDESAAVKYEICQDDGVIAVSTSGNFEDVSVDSFEIGEAIYIKVYDSKGKCVKTRVNLEITKDVSVEDFTFGLKTDKISFAVPDDVPFLGGSNLSLALPELNWDVYMEGSTFHIGYNTKIKEYERKLGEAKSEEEKKETKDEFDKYTEDLKESIETIKKYSGQKISKSNKDNLKKLLAEDKNLDFPAAGKVKVTFAGYGELEFSETGVSSGKINICVAVDFSVDKTWQTMVWVVPVVVNVGVGLNIGSAAELAMNWDTDTLEGNWTLNVTPRLEAFGGVGIGKAIGVGATGSADLAMNIQLIGTTAPFGFNSVDLTGQLGLKAYAAFLTYEKPFAYHTWHLYSRTKYKSLKKAASEAVYDNEDIYDLSNYKLADISYLEDRSDWLADKVKLKAPLKLKENYKVMLNDTYRNSQPVVVSDGTNTVAAFISAGEGRDVYNIPTLVYSVYNSSMDTWSAPVKVDSNDTMDQAPYLYSDGADIWLIYSDSEKTFSESDYMSFAEHQSIAVAKFDSTTKTFSAPVVIEQADGVYNSVPEISVVDGVPVAVWQSNTDTDVFGKNSTNSIMCSVFTDGVWSEAETVKEALNSIVGYTVGKIGSDIKIAYITDDDNNLSTIDDRTLTVTDFEGNAEAVLTGALSNPVFETVPGRSGEELICFADGNIAIIDAEGEVEYLKENAIDGFTDSFVVLEDRILFLSSTEESSNIFALMYDEKNGTWSDKVQLTTQDKYIDVFDAFVSDGKIISVMTRKDINITEDAVEDACQLCWIALTSKTDITIEDVFYDHAQVVPGENLPVSIDVINNGDEKVESLNVTITDQDGDVKVSQTVETSISSAESQVVTVELPVDETVTLKDYTVYVEADNGKSDFNEEDNSYDFTLGFVDFQVTAENVKIGNNDFVCAFIKNNSYVQDGGTVKVYNLNSEESAIATSVFTKIGYGKSISVMFPVDEESLGGDEGIITVKVIPESTSEYYEYNNISSCYISKKVAVAPEGVEIRPETEIGSVYEGDTLKFIANVYPEKAENKNVFWSSSDERVATVSADGDVTAVAAGEVSITATTEEGGFAAVKKLIIEHKFGDWVTTLEPTDEVSGQEERKCSVCGHTESREILPMKRIAVGETVEINVAEGETVYLKFVPEVDGRYAFCSDSDDDTYGYLYNDKYEVLTSDDDDGIGSNFKVVYDLEAGETYYWGARYYDSDESGSFYVNLEKTCEHLNTEYLEETSATCSVPGRSEGEYCHDCSTWVWGGSEYYADHDYYFLPNAKEPVTCTEGGYLDEYCRNCDMVYEYYDWSEARHFDVNADTRCDYCGQFTNKEIISANAAVTEYELTYVEFIPAVSGTYVFESTFPSDYDGYADTYGCLYNSSKEELTYNDDGGYNNNFRIRYECTENVTYYLGIRFYSDREGTIPYKIVLEDVSKSHVHSFKLVKTVNATCKADGAKYYECACGISKSEPLKKTTTHSYDGGKITKAATCAAAGTKTFTCKICGVKKTETIKATGGHTGGAATCKDLAKCTVCGQHYGSVNKNNHKSLTILKAVSATCTKTGLTEGKKCTACGVTTVAQQTVKATGHNLTALKAVAPTYTKTGLTEGKKCKTCGTVTVAQKKVDRKKLKKVSGLKVTPSTTSLKLSWSKVTGAEKYEVYYSTNGKSWKKVTATKNSVTIKKLKKGTSYKIKVRAVAGSNKGSYSSVLSTATKPTKVNLSKVTAGSKKLTASWKTVSGASGYQVMYSTSSKFKSSKTSTVKKGSSKKTTIKKLKKGKKYYVKVRAYKSVGGKKIYGSWSAVKSVKVK